MLVQTKSAGSHRVLIVNEFADGREMYVTFLQYHHLVALGTASPECALEIVDRFRPSVIVTDLVFPHSCLDGIAFIAAIRRRSQALCPVIIVVSGLISKTDERRARDAGADSYFIKPFLPEHLLSEVQRAFEAGVLVASR